MHILIVDDDAEIRNVYSMAFAMLGHHARSAASGPEAVTLIEQQQRREHGCFDAVLLDVEMPTMSGWQVLGSVRNMPCADKLPIVMFTAYGNVTSDSYAKMLGAYALLHKLVAAKTILEVIENARQECGEGSAI